MLRIILLLLINTCFCYIYAQEDYYVYPPLCEKSINTELVENDSVFTRIDCKILSDSVSIFYIKSDLINMQSIPGWAIIYSQWNENNLYKNLIVNEMNYTICLNHIDQGYEFIMNPLEIDEINGIYQRRRPILILNLYTCKVYYLENKELFQLHTNINR